MLIDDLLMVPFSGFGFILRTLQKVAEEQFTDDAPMKERLLELQLKLESGEVSEEEYADQEAGIIRQLREIENRKRALAGAPSAEQDRGLAFRAGEAKASASVTFPSLTRALARPMNVASLGDAAASRGCWARQTRLVAACRAEVPEARDR